MMQFLSFQTVPSLPGYWFALPETNLWIGILPRQPGLAGEIFID